MRCALGLVALVAALSATAASGTAERYAYWHFRLTGVQVMHWDLMEQFGTIDGSGACDVRHHGDQTIRFSTPGTVRVALGGGYTTPLFTRHAGSLRGLVPLAGTEQRVHTVLNAPPDVSNCYDKARERVAAAPCSGTESINKGAVIKVELRRLPRTVSMFIPFGLGFQPVFRQQGCNSPAFDITQSFLSPLFTRGAHLQLHGGRFSSKHAKLSGRFATGAMCLRNWPDAGYFVKCSAPHNADVATSWQMTFSR